MYMYIHTYLLEKLSKNPLYTCILICKYIHQYVTYKLLYTIISDVLHTCIYNYTHVHVHAHAH